MFQKTYSDKQIFSWLRKNITMPANLKLAKKNIDHNGMVLLTENGIIQQIHYPMNLYREHYGKLYILDKYAYTNELSVIRIFIEDSVLGNFKDFFNKNEEIIDLYLPELKDKSIFEITGYFFIKNPSLIMFDKFGTPIATLDDLTTYIPELQKNYDKVFQVFDNISSVEDMYEIVESNPIYNIEVGNNNYQIFISTNKFSRLFLKAYVKALDFEEYSNFLMSIRNYYLEISSIEYSFYLGISKEESFEQLENLSKGSKEFHERSQKRILEFKKIHDYLLTAYVKNPKHSFKEINHKVGLYEFEEIISQIEMDISTIERNLLNEYVDNTGRVKKGYLITQREFADEQILNSSKESEKDEFEKRFQFYKKKAYWKDDVLKPVFKKYLEHFKAKKEEHIERYKL